MSKFPVCKHPDYICKRVHSKLNTADNITLDEEGHWLYGSYFDEGSSRLSLVRLAVRDLDQHYKTEEAKDLEVVIRSYKSGPIAIVGEWLYFTKAEGGKEETFRVQWDGLSESFEPCPWDSPDVDEYADWEWRHAPICMLMRLNISARGQAFQDRKAETVLKKLFPIKYLHAGGDGMLYACESGNSYSAKGERLMQIDPKNLPKSKDVVKVVMEDVSSECCFIHEDSEYFHFADMGESSPGDTGSLWRGRIDGGKSSYKPVLERDASTISMLHDSIMNAAKIEMLEKTNKNLSAASGMCSGPDGTICWGGIGKDADPGKGLLAIDPVTLKETELARGQVFGVASKRRSNNKKPTIFFAIGRARGVRGVYALVPRQ
mmetsp:Transcript_4335/g.8687  ORF Transcript_4335/g.8687 Transcript_4335/m.8687 type:complete len:375 (-) Transcript_4335:72-1196(-)|eukprot:CAMPEP_0170199204 /NCGR_PEP_ID=MMETSP0040_2-20121228/69210_1 /TAXON_ID=641309 /ORGANISM="Lotharella oceanica, Strain CCMP622" /LENGTH=374 /DNA_ID=CAMNT_0010449301 /DNA_START=2637 /DNA_END=3761 /DNA_ORIENTATION=-